MKTDDGNPDSQPVHATEVRQIKDEKLIKQRISELPSGIRDIMEEKFKGDFVSIEKIDKTKLL